MPFPGRPRARSAIRARCRRSGEPTMKSMTFLLALLLLAGRADAHSVPIDPSLCTFDPVDITAPSTGFAAIAAPPAATDTFRIVWDPGSSRAQLCSADPADPTGRCATVPPER